MADFAIRLGLEEEDFNSSPDATHTVAAISCSRLRELIDEGRLRRDEVDCEALDAQPEPDPELEGSCCVA